MSFGVTIIHLHYFLPLYNAGFFLAFIKPAINPIVENLFVTGIELIGTQFLDDI